MKERMKTLIILTLKKHQDGIWIHKLVKSLQVTAKDHHIFLSHDASSDDGKTTPNIEINTSEHDVQPVSIRVQPLEEWLAEGWLVSSSSLSFFDNVIGIVNRVSDAANPPLFKACCAILGAARLCKIPIVNGPTTYSLCGNKWCHHIFFQQAGLESPKTLAFWNDDYEGNIIRGNLGALETHGLQSSHDDSDLSLLIKPNSGGFGAGIQRVNTPLLEEPLPRFEDRITLVQDYHPPKDNQLYRVWFLLGKVQCAVVRSIGDGENNNEFTNACSGACSIQTPPTAWQVPDDVRKELEDQLFPLLTDAHCGSVEFLQTRDDNKKRLYFDLNLLSTLPTKVSKTKGVWEDDYDPWMELGNAVWIVVTGKAGG